MTIKPISKNNVILKVGDKCTFSTLTYDYPNLKIDQKITIAEVFDKIPKPKISDLFPTLFLTVHPVQSVTSITYTDTNETEQTWNASLYKVDTYRKAARITPAYGEVFPDILAEINSLTVTYVAGYGDASSDVPASIRQAVRLVLSDMYHNRSDFVKEKYSASQSLLDRLNYNLFIGI